ncbi:MAG TPA: hypothetical protein VLJ59_08060 [Mycobacteriales bacterium]|nr:hypothetical protein [Mycobacteriales bacterium]
MHTVVIVAEHWYSSGTLWTAIGVFVALLIGVPTFLVTWVPRQRLYYRAAPATPLVAPGMRGVADLEIRHDGRLLADPFLVEVKLTARGRRDIPSSAFDQGRSLVFDLSAEIVKVMQVRCSPVSSLTPPVTYEGSSLRIGPELIGRSQTTTISVLVDGDQPSLVCTQPVLAQVTLTPQGPPDGSPQRLALALALASLALASLALAPALGVAVAVATAVGALAVVVDWAKT